MQIKTTMRYHFTPSEWPLLRINKQVLARMWKKGIPSALLVGIQTGATTVENSMEFPQKLKMELPLDPVILLLGLYPKNSGTPIPKNLCTLMSIAVLFIVAKCWKQPKCPSANEWIKKLWYI